MAETITVHQVDVFTRVPFAGNPAAVVLDADELNGETMQAIAREMNLSETAFVFEAEPEGTVPVRFFTPAREVPACGHATLGAHFVRARRLGAAAGSVTQRSPGARWGVRWETDSGATMVVMRQSPVEEGPEWDPRRRRMLLEALGVGEDHLMPGAPIRTVSTGHAKVMIPIRSAKDLMEIEPSVTALTALSRVTGVSGYFLFAPDDDGKDTLTVCRMFAPAIGVPEDPVNGSGHGPLGVYLASRGGPAADRARQGFWSRMGDHLGRPGRVWVQVLEAAGAVDVGGFVAPLFTAEISLEREEGRP